MSKPAVAPYPPDLDDDAPAEIEFGNFVDAFVRDVDWAGKKGVGLPARRVELRGCDLAGLRGGEALRGARMPFGDVLENAFLLASLTGIEILADG